MSNNKGNILNVNLEFTPLNNRLNDEEIIINNNEQENDCINNYQYYNNNILYKKASNMEEGEDEEKSDDTIVAFQEEKNSNLIESNNNILSKDSTNENDDEFSRTNKTGNIYKENLNNINNAIPSKKSKGFISLKKNKTKKKKKKKEKGERIEIVAQSKNKLKQIKISNNIKKNKKDTNDKKQKKLIKITDPMNMLRSKSLSKSIKQMPDKVSGSVEFSPSKIIYENGVSDDEDEIKKISKKKIKRKINLKPIITPFLQSIKDKNEYNIRLQKIRQQFTEKKFVHEQKCFYYVLKPGNGATLVKNSMKHRTNWKEAQMNVTSLYNFKWQPSTLCIDYKNLSAVESIPQIVNHFEFHTSISNKSNMFLNLFEYCESHNINIWKFVPFTIFISPKNDNESSFDELYDNIISYIVNFNDMSKNLNLKKEDERYSDIFKTMKFSIFGRRKDVPKDTWMMGSRTPLQIPDVHFEGKNFWLLKASNLNRGQCIRLVDSKEKFHEIIRDWSVGINLKGVNKGITDNNIQFKITNENNNQNKDEIPMSDTYVTQKIIAQKYIEKPLCYYGRKCDMRVWVLLTQDMKVFVYKEGHLKTCSEKFDINNNKDAFVHITNYSFQKHCLNFQKFELGNEVPFHDFQKYLDLEYKDQKINVKEHIMNQVKYIVELTMKSIKEKINPNKRNFCFEIFGYDFMMDVNLNVFLIEINTNPGLEISSPWIKAIVPRMVDDALRLTLDEVFPTKYQFDKNAITEINYEDYTNDLTNKNEKEEIKNVEIKNEQAPRIVKKKIYKTICDQGTGQDNNDEYAPENMRKKEIRIKIKLNDVADANDRNNLENNQEENTKNNIMKDKNANDANKEKNNLKINNNNISNKKEIKKEETEKEFDQRDYKSPFPVPGYEAWENLWEFVCELVEEKPQVIYPAGVKGLLEIQKKRQTASAPNNNIPNKKINQKNNNNANSNNPKDKNINNKNIKEYNINTNNKDNKKNNKNIKNNEQKENKIEDKQIKEKNENEKKIIKEKENLNNENIKKDNEIPKIEEEQKNEESKIEEEQNNDVPKGEEEQKNEEIENEKPYKNNIENNQGKEIENNKDMENNNMSNENKKEIDIKEKDKKVKEKGEFDELEEDSDKDE